MAEYDINVGRDLLPELLSGQNGLEKLVEAVKPDTAGTDSRVLGDRAA